MGGGGGRELLKESWHGSESPSCMKRTVTLLWHHLHCAPLSHMRPDTAFRHPTDLKVANHGLRPRRFRGVSARGARGEEYGDFQPTVA